MSEWVYSFHLVIRSAQLGNSCVHAGRVQTSDNIKIRLISENMFALVGIVWVARGGFYHMQRIEFHFDAILMFTGSLVPDVVFLFFLLLSAHPTVCSLEIWEKKFAHLTKPECWDSYSGSMATISQQLLHHPRLLTQSACSLLFLASRWLVCWQRWGGRGGC